MTSGKLLRKIGLAYILVLVILVQAGNKLLWPEECTAREYDDDVIVIECEERECAYEYGEPSPFYITTNNGDTTLEA